MPKKEKKFADDGWAVWVDGNDTSTVYLNDWLNPTGQSYIDIALRIRGIKSSKAIYVYVPYTVFYSELVDVSLRFNDTRILQAIFNSACIIDYKKNDYTSEIAYNGKTVDIVHISALNYKLELLSSGTLVSINLDELQPYLDNDEAYFIWRMPHKTLNEIFKSHVDVGDVMSRLRDLITTPVISEKYGYSIRINESRLLPEAVTRIGAFHRQKLKKALVSLSINENYEINDAGCYRIHRLEENLYSDYLPEDYSHESVITYQWVQSRENNMQGQFNFYYNIAKNSISRISMFLYMVLLMTIGVVGNLIASLIWGLFTGF